MPVLVQVQVHGTQADYSVTSTQYSAPCRTLSCPDVFCEVIFEVQQRCVRKPLQCSRRVYMGRVVMLRTCDTSNM